MAFKLNPQLPAKARLPLAYCYYSQKKYTLARKTFERVLQLDPDNVDSRIGLMSLAQRCGDKET